MIATAQNATQAPIQAQRGPIIRMNAPTGPVRVMRPAPNSTRMSGMDHSSRKTTQVTRKEPPPFCAAIRGNRQMLPVPTAMPSMASIMSQREEKDCWSSTRDSGVEVREAERAPPQRGLRPPGFQVPLATAGTNLSTPGGGNGRVRSCSALM